MMDRTDLTFEMFDALSIGPEVGSIEKSHDADVFNADMILYDGLLLG